MQGKGEQAVFRWKGLTSPIKTNNQPSQINNNNVNKATCTVCTRGCNIFKVVNDQGFNK